MIARRLETQPVVPLTQPSRGRWRNPLNCSEAVTSS